MNDAPCVISVAPFPVRTFRFYRVVFDRRGGVILHGRWTCQECVDNGTHTEDLQCGTPGCECSQCDYRGSNFDGE